MAMNTGWITKMIDGVKTKVFAISHVKSTYYNYKEGVTLDKMLIETEDFNQEAVTEPEISPAILYEINEVAEASAASFSLLNKNKAESTDVYTIAEVDNLLGPVQEKLDTLGELATKDIVSENDLDSEMLLKVNNIQTTTDHTLHKSKDGGAKLNHMVGATKQNQYKGYQLFDASKLPTTTQGGATVTNNGDGSFTISGSGKITESLMDYYELNKEEINRILVVGNVICVNGGEGIEPSIQLRLYSENGNAITILSSYTSNGKLTITESIANSCTNMRFYIMGAVDTTIITGTIKPMFYIDDGKCDGTWEPFTDGQPSPSPEYPQSLNHTGDCVEMVQGDISTADGSFRPNNTHFVTTKYNTPCEEGDVVKVNTEKTLEIWLFYYNSNGFVYYNYAKSTSELTFVIPSNATSFKVVIGSDDNIYTPETVGKIQLTVNGKYVGQIMEHGKNLFNSSTIRKSRIVDDKTGNMKESSNSCASDYIEVEGGKPYYISPRLTNGNWGAWYDENRTFISGIMGYDTYHVAPTNAKYLMVTVNYANSNPDYATNFQVEQNTELTPYEPYQEHITTYYTSEPLRDDDGLVPIDGLWNVERNSAEVVFDGSDDEKWTFSDAYRAFAIAVKNLKVAKGTEINYICSHLHPIPNSNTWENVSDWISNFETILYLHGNEITTLDEWKAYLQTNPYTVEYELATPTYEVLDTASQIALNSLKSFNGVTYVEVDSRVQPQEVSFDYGTSHVGARVIKAENDNRIEKIKRQELEAELKELRTALVALGSEV